MHAAETVAKSLPIPNAPYIRAAQKADVIAGITRAKNTGMNIKWKQESLRHVRPSQPSRRLCC